MIFLFLRLILKGYRETENLLGFIISCRKANILVCQPLYLYPSNFQFKLANDFIQLILIIYIEYVLSENGISTENIFDQDTIECFKIEITLSIH